MSIISYAQNFEDVMLWRALSHIEKGFYIDIGAQDPLIDSVSLAFHQRGWHGIHVEPTSHYAELLRQHRPGDTVIQAAVGTGPTVLRFFEISGGGLSTADSAIAAQHRQRGINLNEITVACISLNDVFHVCMGQEIHWLKIDVEGFEQQVLSSWGLSVARPWIVVIESTLPLTQIETHASWESILIAYGYGEVYFDGLNRYYVSDEHPELKGAFLSPPNVFDGFTLNGTSSATFHKLIDGRYQEKINEIIADNELQKKLAQNKIDDLVQRLVTSDKTYAEAEKSRLQREEELYEQYLHSQEELRNLLRIQVKVEKEIAAQLLAVQQQAAYEQRKQVFSHDEQVHALRFEYSKREQFFTAQLKAGQEEERFVQRSELQKNKQYLEKIDQSRQALEDLLRHQIQHEQGIATQLMVSQQLAARERIEQLRSHDEQEHLLRHEHVMREEFLKEQLNEGREELRRHQEQAQLEKVQVEKFWQASEATLLIQIRREQEVSTQLLGIQQQAYNALHLELANMRDDLCWRLTTPLRGLARYCFKREANIPGLIKAAPKESRVRDTADSIAETASLNTQKSNFNNLLSEKNNVTNSPFVQVNSFNLIKKSHNLEILLQHQGENFIKAIYFELLRREPDSEGLDYYLRRLQAGVPKIQIIAQLLNSSEAKKIGSSFTGLQKIIYFQKLVKSLSILTLIKLILFKNNYSLVGEKKLKNSKSKKIALIDIEKFNGEIFIEKCYTALLHRDPDPAGKAYYLKRLQAGNYKAEIIASMVNGPEGRRVGQKIIGLRTKRLVQVFLSLPLLGHISETLLLLINSRHHAKVLRRLESQPISSGGAALSIKENSFDELVPAFINAMSSAHSAMRETQRHLIAIEAKVQEAQINKSSDSTTQFESRIEQLEKALILKSEQWQEITPMLEPIRNLLTSHPLDSRINAQAIHHIKFQIDKILTHVSSCDTVENFENKL